MEFVSVKEAYERAVVFGHPKLLVGISIQYGTEFFITFSRSRQPIVLLHILFKAVFNLTWSCGSHFHINCTIGDRANSLPWHAKPIVSHLKGGLTALFFACRIGADFLEIPVTAQGAA
jgi:hypothetical protein